MTREELRKEQGYIEAHNKITNYKKGFKFTIYYNEIPKPKRRAMEILLQDCKKEKLIESISIGLALNGELTDETYIRL